MPSRAYWMAVAFVRRRTAPLEAWYCGLLLSVPTRPSWDEMLMIDPPPARRMAGMAAFVPRNTPLALMSIVRVQSSTVVSSIRPHPPMPALLTRTFSAPKRDAARPTAACQSASLVTSSRTKSASPPLALMSASTAWPSATRMSPMTTRAQARLGGTHPARTPADQRDLPGKSHGRLVRASGDGQAAGSAAESPLALLVGTDGSQEVDLAEGRPVRVAEVEFAVGALPQEEAREPDLTAGADDEIRIRQVRRVEVLADRLLGDAVDDGLEVFPLLASLAEHGLNRVDDLLTAPVCDREREDHLAIAGRRLLGGPDRRDRRVGQKVELSDGADTETEAVELRMPGERGELGFDGREDSGYLGRRPPEVVRREHPQADGRNADLGAPLEHVVELVGPERVRLAKVGYPALEGEAAVAVEDDAEMPGNGAVPNLTEQEPRVEVIEEAAHGQKFTLAPSGRASQENRGLARPAPADSRPAPAD